MNLVPIQLTIIHVAEGEKVRGGATTSSNSLLESKIKNKVTELFLGIKLSCHSHKAYLPCVPWETKKRQWFKKNTQIIF